MDIVWYYVWECLIFCVQLKYAENLEPEFLLLKAITLNYFYIFEL